MKQVTPAELVGLVDASGITYLRHIRNTKNYGLRAYVFECKDLNGVIFQHVITPKFINPGDFRSSFSDFTPEERRTY